MIYLPLLVRFQDFQFKSLRLRLRKTRLEEALLPPPSGSDLDLWKWDWKIETSKSRFYSPYRAHIQSFNFLAQLEWELGEEQPFFEVKKRENLHISPPNWPKRLIFGCFSISDCLSIRLKRNYFLDFSPSAYPLSDLSTTEFWFKVIPTLYH